MKHSIFGYLLGEGFRNVFHNKKSSGASLAIMCATMLIFGLFFMIIENLNHAVETLESQQGMQVFIEKDATDSQITQIGQQLKQLDGVNTVTFVSKEEALNSVKEKLKDQQALLATWDEANPFKASYLITLTDLKLSNQVQEEIKKIDNIASITSRDNTINGLITIANAVRVISAVILTLLVLISIVILGTAYSLLANAITGSSLINKMGMSLLGFSEMLSLLIIVYLALGIGIGTIGSSLSMRKYLKV